jgi:hypothetical protein
VERAICSCAKYKKTNAVESAGDLMVFLLCQANSVS